VSGSDLYDNLVTSSFQATQTRCAEGLIHRTSNARVAVRTAAGGSQRTADTADEQCLLSEYSSTVVLCAADVGEQSHETSSLLYLFLLAILDITSFSEYLHVRP